MYTYTYTYIHIYKNEEKRHKWPFQKSSVEIIPLFCFTWSLISPPFFFSLFSFYFLRKFLKFKLHIEVDHPVTWPCLKTHKFTFPKFHSHLLQIRPIAWWLFLIFIIQQGLLPHSGPFPLITILPKQFLWLHIFNFFLFL